MSPKRCPVRLRIVKRQGLGYELECKIKPGYPWEPAYFYEHLWPGVRMGYFTHWGARRGLRRVIEWEKKRRADRQPSPEPQVIDEVEVTGYGTTKRPG